MRSNTLKTLLLGAAFLGSGILAASAGTLDEVKANDGLRDVVAEF